MKNKCYDSKIESAPSNLIRSVFFFLAPKIVLTCVIFKMSQIATKKCHHTQKSSRTGASTNECSLVSSSGFPFSPPFLQNCHWGNVILRCKGGGQFGWPRNRLEWIQLCSGGWNWQKGCNIPLNFRQVSAYICWVYSFNCWELHNPYCITFYM